MDFESDLTAENDENVGGLYRKEIRTIKLSYSGTDLQSGIFLNY